MGKTENTILSGAQRSRGKVAKTCVVHISKDHISGPCKTCYIFWYMS